MQHELSVRARARLRLITRQLVALKANGFAGDEVMRLEIEATKIRENTNHIS